MLRNLRSRFQQSRFRFVICLLVIAAAAAGLTRVAMAVGSASAEDEGSRRIDILVAQPTPSPPACFPCWWRMTIGDNFDSVTPPALPGWIATNAQGPPPLWGTSDSGVPIPPADTAPNAAFIDDPPVVSDKLLDSFSFAFFEGIDPVLTFRHNFNLEASDVDPNLGFDGGVLEMSTDGGNTFQDIREVGHFVMGGYNRTISSDRGSPIAGRQAWSGNSKGFITTVVSLPNLQTPNSGILRWRMASDTSGADEGWRVDTVSITWCQGQGPPCSPSPTPTATPRATPRPRPSPLPRPTVRLASLGHATQESFDGPPTPTPRGRRFTPFPRPTPP